VIAVQVAAVEVVQVYLVEEVVDVPSLGAQRREMEVFQTGSTALVCLLAKQLFHVANKCEWMCCYLKCGLRPCSNVR